MKIEVNVGDVNDNAPKCPSEETTFEVQENEEIGMFDIQCSSFIKDQHAEIKAIFFY